MQSRFKQIKYLLADMTFTLKFCNFTLNTFQDFV